MQNACPPSAFEVRVLVITCMDFFLPSTVRVTGTGLVQPSCIAAAAATADSSLTADCRSSSRVALTR